MEGKELLLDVMALGEEGFDVGIDTSLVSDGFMKEASHSTDIGEASDMVDETRSELEWGGIEGIMTRGLAIKINFD